MFCRVWFYLLSSECVRNRFFDSILLRMISLRMTDMLIKDI